VILAEGTAGGSVPYFRIPSVGVSVGPVDTGCVAVAVGFESTGPLVAVAGVVVKFGSGVDDGSSVTASITSVVGDDSAKTGVAVSVGGAVVGEG